MEKPIKIKINWENNSETWWDNARGGYKESCPPEMLDLLEIDGPSEIYVVKSSADEILNWCESIHGWDNGPKFAPHPIVFEAEE